MTNTYLFILSDDIVAIMSAGRIRILLLDNNPNSLQLYNSNLRSPDFELITAHTDLEVLEKFIRDKPDLIIWDIENSPQIGAKVCRFLKRHPKYHYIPLILVYENDFTHASQLGLEVHASAYIHKSAPKQQLHLIIQLVLKDQQATVAQKKTHSWKIIAK